MWFDLDEDGIQDSEEPNMEGVTINLYLADGTFLATTTTDANGEYLFANLAAGSYLVEVVSPVGYVYTRGGAADDEALDSDFSPTNGRTVPLYVVAGVPNLYIDAGLILSPERSSTNETPTSLDEIAEPDS